MYITRVRYSCLENPMDRGTWWVHRVTKRQTRLSLRHRHTQTHTDTHRHTDTQTHRHRHTHRHTHTQTHTHTYTEGSLKEKIQPLMIY